MNTERFTSSRVVTFAGALRAAKWGSRITRQGWDGPGQWVAIRFPDEDSKMQLPYFYMKNVGGNCVPWAPSVGDLLAEDWEILD